LGERVKRVANQGPVSKKKKVESKQLSGDGKRESTVLNSSPEEEREPHQGFPPGGSLNADKKKILGRAQRRKRGTEEAVSQRGSEGGGRSKSKGMSECRGGGLREVKAGGPGQRGGEKKSSRTLQGKTERQKKSKANAMSDGFATRGG